MNVVIDHSTPIAHGAAGCPLSRSDRVPVLGLDVGASDLVGLDLFGSGRDHRTNFLQARDIAGQ